MTKMTYHYDDPFLTPMLHHSGKFSEWTMELDKLAIMSELRSDVIFIYGLGCYHSFFFVALRFLISSWISTKSKR